MILYQNTELTSQIKNGKNDNKNTSYNLLYEEKNTNRIQIV